VLGSFSVQYQYASGVMLEYRMAGRPLVRFEGTEGWVEAEWWMGLQSSSPDLVREPIESDGLTSRQVNEKTDFIDAIKTNRPTLIPAEARHRTNSLCQLGLIASQCGRALDWDPATESFANDAAANKLLHRSLRGPWEIG
jgi:myo-inositol 2-dehydrogenase / D-chiro-inositol 1-dehydrogenase